MNYYPKGFRFVILRTIVDNYNTDSFSLAKFRHLLKKKYGIAAMPGEKDGQKVVNTLRILVNEGVLAQTDNFLRNRLIDIDYRIKPESYAYNRYVRDNTPYRNNAGS